jgi:hypothetical protein
MLLHTRRNGWLLRGLPSLRAVPYQFLRRLVHERRALQNPDQQADGNGARADNTDFPDDGGQHDSSFYMSTTMDLPSRFSWVRG